MAEEKEEVARSVAEQFDLLDPETKHKWVDEMLTALVNMTAKQRKKFLSSTLMKQGKPTVKDMEKVNQLITCFLYSLRDEYRYHYAFMLLKALKLPTHDIPGKLAKVRSFMWIHAAVKPETYKRMMTQWKSMKLDLNNFEHFDKFFNGLLDAAK